MKITKFDIICPNILNIISVYYFTLISRVFFSQNFKKNRRTIKIRDIKRGEVTG